MKPVLWCLSYSPWSEKAVWPLEARGVEFVKQPYKPLLDEPKLRRIRGVDGPASVPVLVLADRVLTESLDIGLWAASQGAGPTLLPEGREADLRAWDALAEKGMAAGRVLSLHRVLRDPDALLDLVPRNLRWTRPIARAISAFGVRRTLRKYGYGETAEAEARANLEEVLDTLRADLAKAPEGAPQHLFGTFSLADIVMAQALVFVTPPAKGVRIATASRRAFTDPELSAKYADLLAWRDALYEKHRP